jgi:hypothetical protein
VPITARPDPNNPGKFIWVDSATGQPATQPGGANTPYVAPSDQPAQAPVTNVNIDPNASKTATSTTGPAAGPAAGPAGPGTPSVGGYTPAQIVAPLDDEFDKANATVATLWQGIQDQQTKVQAARDALAASAYDPTKSAALNSEISALNAQYTSYSQALQRVETANATRSTALTKAIHDGTVDPSQVDVAKAQADDYSAAAKQANANAKVLLDGAESQRALAAANAASANADSQLKQIQAKTTADKSPAEINNLNAQADALRSQKNSTDALLPGLIQKQKDDSSLTQAQTKLTDANSDLTQATIGKTTAEGSLAQANADLAKGQLGAGLPGAQAAQAQGAGAQSQAAAAASTAGIQQAKLGPLYGLQDQIKAIQTIQQQVFGPGGSGDPNDANDLLKQFTTATLSGTTPYAANVAAANAGLTAFGTQASLTNAAQAAAASRANQYTGTAGSVLGSLLGVMKDAPAGSQALGPAFADAMGQIAQGTQAPQFAAPQMPQAPALPALLQKLAPPAAPTGPAPAPPMLRPPAPAAAPTTAPTTSAPVTINIGGQGQSSGAPPSSPQQFPGLAQGSSAQGTALSAGPGLPMPSVLQNYAPPTTDYVHQLWGNELGSGAVKSPYAAIGQGVS